MNKERKQIKPHKTSAHKRKLMPYRKKKLNIENNRR